MTKRLKGYRRQKRLGTTELHHCNTETFVEIGNLSNNFSWRLLFFYSQ